MHTAKPAPADVLAYFDSLPTNRRGTALAVHTYLVGLPGITCAMRYGVPFYSGHKWIAYLGTSHGLELCFLEARHLQTHAGLLQYHGRKAVAGFALEPADAIDWDTLQNVIADASQIDADIAAKRLLPGIGTGRRRQ